ncbi:hypothetical protein BYT27DRAFT_7225035 [Phlegmacium glaucopus]|nr:hypothetical protein BYT27DRAFT_7225035 [Phlegmacium glaucopus]
MPPKKTTVSRKANAQKGAKVSEVTPQLETDVSDLHSELELREKYQKLYREVRTERQGRARGLMRNSVLKEKITVLKAINMDISLEVKEHSHISAEATKALAKLQDRHAFITEKIMGSMRNLEEHMQEKVGVVKQKLKESSKVIATLRKAQKSSSSRQEWAEKSVQKLLHKGVYTDETCSLVRQLTHAGCSQSKVGYIITTVFQSAGVETVGKVSCRSVNRMIKEGYLAAQLQLGHEMANAESMTFSADGTSHRGINYNSRHVNLKAEDYGSESGEACRTTRFLGVQSSADGTSEESIKDMKKILGNIVDLYNRSPLGKRAGNLCRELEILIKVTGVHKKDAALLESEKRDAVNQILGEQVMLDKTNEQLYHIIDAAEKQLMNDIGGVLKWVALSVEEQIEAKAMMMEAIVIHLGEQAFTLLSSDEQRILRLFIWAGCGCHKDLNTVRGGNGTMKKWWEENDIDPPILLANRDNAAVLKEVGPGDDVVTSAQERAFEMTDRGGIKATQLAGAICNHKNDKVGHHNVFRWWWEKNVGSQFTFPDTSNTRFQSHCNAAAALLLHLPHYILINPTVAYLQSKENLWNALHCTATKTEMAVLALYAQAITHPYMKVVCATGEKQENMLNLGPFHQRVQNHMQRIIEIVNAIQKMSPELPYLEPLLVSFFKGASETWKRFTSEFAPGGLIDEATVEERELAWMPATNDVNEGALGSFRVLLHRQPQLTQQGLALKKQLKIFKLAGAPNLKKINTSTKVDDIRKALMDSIQLYRQGEWAPTMEIEDDTGEDFAWESEDDESGN